MKSPRRPAARIARASAGAGIAAGLVVLSVAQAGAAVGAPKSSGTIKIHAVGTGETDNSNEPKVCAFTLVGDNFDANEEVSYGFVLGAPFKDAPVKTGTVTADAQGSFSTAVINLDPGHYKATLLDGETNKEKVFKVECDPVVDEPPVDEPPVDEPPVDEPPVDEPPVDEPPVDEPPVDEPPVDEPPVDPNGDPDPEPAPVTEVDTEVVLPAPLPDVVEHTTETEAGAAPVGAVPEEGTVTGTWAPHAESAGSLPQTGSGAAGIGVAGLLLVGAGLGLRRAARGQAN